MRRWLKGLLGGELRDDSVDASLEGRRRSDVDNAPATRAEEVVVMLGQIFSQFKPRELVTCRDTPDHSGSLKVYKMSVGRASRHVRELGSDIRDADRVPA